jgi:hypothetical protein
MKTQNIQVDPIPAFRTSDTRFAAFLITSGHIPDEPALLKYDHNGKTTMAWLFGEEAYGDISVSGRTFNESLEVWKQGISFIKDNPDDKQALIMQGLKTHNFLTEQANRDDLPNTYSYYLLSGATFPVVKGSKREKQLIKAGGIKQ